MRHLPRNGRRGFTMIELMASLVAGLALVTILYSVGRGSVRHFHRESRVANTQLALRQAAAQVQSDFARAGFGGTADAAREQTCQAPSFRVQAVEICDRSAGAAGISASNIPNAAGNGVEADIVRLTGNYVTSDSYRIANISGGSTIALQQDWQSYRRSFMNIDPADATAATFDPDFFDSVFLPGRAVHIQTEAGQHFFYRIASRSSANSTITVAGTIPVGTTCFPGLGNGATVTPLSRIEYRVAEDAGGVNALGLTNLVRDGTSALASELGLVPSVLIRREIEFRDGVGAASCDEGTPVAGTTRVVMEWTANFDVDAIVNTAAFGDAQLMAQRLDGDAENASIANPHQIRGLIVNLSARTPDRDPEFRWRPRAANAPLTRFQVNASDDETMGAARVRNAHFEVFLPNIQRGLP